MMSNISTSCALSEDEILVSDSRNISSDDSSTQYDNEITTQERLKILFKPKYQMRRVTNKGAIFVLVCNFLVTTVYYYTSYKSYTQEQYCQMCFQLIMVPLGLVLMFAGFLGDVYFKRYKVLLWSIIIMWISAVSLTTAFLVESLVLFKNYIQLVFIVSLGIGYGGFQANIIQFGIDQLTDASTNEILSFINWYSWSYISSAVVANFASKCSPPQNEFIAPFLLCFALSVVTCLFFICNNVLIKEPITQNPFKLIYRVLKYAKRHKHPQQRSAFTYCEDDIPSRIDFGKMKYGGPFTTEQVEDVKTFFGVLGLVLMVSSIFGITDENEFKIYTFGKTISARINTYPFSECSYAFVFTDLYYISVAILIPINELLIYPLFHRCVPRNSPYWKIVIGTLLQIVRYIILVMLITISRQRYIKYDEYFVSNTTAPCIFHNHSFDHNVKMLTTIINSYKLYTIPDVISAFSYIMILTGAIEFLCAQIPYSMKGVIVGLFYGSLVVFFTIGKGIILIFRKTSLSIWSNNHLFGCEFWYLQVKLIVLLIAIVVVILLAISYKKRKREDVLPNEHIFAERFYSKKLKCSN